MHRTRSLPFALLLLAGVSPMAFAQDSGDFHLALGAHQVAPRSHNGALAGGTLPVDVGSDAKPTITGEYFLRDGLGIEVLAALPFEHDIAIAGLGTVGRTKHLPPVVSIQYHFNRDGRVSPFVGAGINYTAFFEEDTRGALAGSRLSLSDSWGAAVHIGVDFKVGERSAIRVDGRWIDIDSRVSLNGTALGEVAIDPTVHGLAWVIHL